MSNDQSVRDDLRLRRGPFVQVEYECFFLPPTILKTYMVIMSFANWHDRAAWPSVRTIARRARMSKTTIISAIKALEAVGLLEVEREEAENGSHIVNHYTINSPSDVDNFARRAQMLFKSVPNFGTDEGGGTKSVPGGGTKSVPGVVRGLVHNDIQENDIQEERDIIHIGEGSEIASATLEEEEGAFASREGDLVAATDNGSPDGGTEPAVTFLIDTHGAAPPDAPDAAAPPAKPRRKRAPRVTEEQAKANREHVMDGIQKVLDAWRKRDEEADAQVLMRVFGLVEAEDGDPAVDDCIPF